MATFTHGVASGDPTQSGVVIWTRVHPANADVPLTWRVAADADLTQVVSTGEANADSDSDYIAQVDVDGLEPGRSYWYGFESGGEASSIATFKTLPTDPDHLRFAVVSCAKYNAGFFNGYARIAERRDLDFVLHLGDYIY
jgi:alkaline phosphatase D